MKLEKLSVKQYVLAIVAALYLATWIWGIPAAHTAITMDLIKSYKAMAKRFPEEVSDRHPYMRFGASYAILPFVTVNHYQYQYAGLAGWGGFTVDLWNGRGRVTIFRMTTWIS